MSHNILLIEDDEALRSAIVGFLKRRGDRVTACSSQAEAERVLARVPDRTQAPEVIISDVSCMELYLKACLRFPHLRWILTETEMNEVEGDRSDDHVAYDATVDQPDVRFPSEKL